MKDAPSTPVCNGAAAVCVGFSSWPFARTNTTDTGDAQFSASLAQQEVDLHTAMSLLVLAMARPALATFVALMAAVIWITGRLAIA